MPQITEATMHTRSMRSGQPACRKSAASIGPAPDQDEIGQAAHTSESVTASQTSRTIRP